MTHAQIEGKLREIVSAVRYESRRPGVGRRGFSAYHVQAIVDDVAPWVASLFSGDAEETDMAYWIARSGRLRQDFLSQSSATDAWLEIARALAQAYRDGQANAKSKTPKRGGRS